MLVRNGRNGQKQHGVDIIGRDGAHYPVGIQCKRKSVWPPTRITVQELDAEVTAADGFAPALKAFYLVTTASPDPALLQHVRNINQARELSGQFQVAVIGWDELVRRATRHPLVAGKHFGSHSSQPAAPLLSTWSAQGGTLMMSDEELAVSIREIIQDLRDFPQGRLVFRQAETEALLLEIKDAQGTGGDLTVAQRTAVLDLRDRLEAQEFREQSIVAGLRLLLGDRILRDYVHGVWDEHSPLLIRSFIEQGIDPNLSSVTGLEQIRLLPPGGQHDIVPIYVPAAEIASVNKHRRKLKKRFPNLDTKNVYELPKPLKFGQAIPAILRRILREVDEGTSVEDLRQAQWLDMLAWQIEY